MVTTFTGVLAPPQAEPARFGLLSAATVIEHTDVDEHWTAGFVQETEACNFHSTLRDMCDPELIDNVFELSDAPRSFEATPFSINAIDRCSTFGYKTIDRRDRVMRQLELVTPKAVERELWDGGFSQMTSNANRWLADPAATDVTFTSGTPVSPKVGLALLEDALGDCAAGIAGVIHMTRAAASVLSGQWRQVPQDPTVQETMLGTRVAAGVGYSGRGPAGTALTSNGVQWMFATGPVTVHLGPKLLINSKTGEAVDIHVNDLAYQAERPAAVTWDGCCHFAVQINLTLA